MNLVDKQMSSILLKYYFTFVLIDLVTSDTSLRQLHVVFRHGERAPTETYKNDPYINMTWSGGWGHLTNRGKFEMYSLGIKLRELYNDFIPAYYFPEDVTVLSSYSDRCLMSAEALLAGLFPPKGEQIWNENLLWQPIPVHYVPRSQDNLIAMKAKCKTYDEELERVLKSEEIQKINEENKELYSYLTEHTGQKIDDLLSTELLYNTLEIELLHNLTLPSWTRNVSLEHMKVIAARSLETFTETNFMKRMKGGVFLKHVISLAGSTKKRPFLFLYSAHDLTLVNILKTLGYKPVLKPGFGASFIIEIYNNSTVVMKYRNEVFSDVELISLKNCTNPCALEKFKEVLEPFILLDWDAECNR